jgi:branched-chain amino acid transport system permease protein
MKIQLRHTHQLVLLSLIFFVAIWGLRQLGVINGYLMQIINLSLIYVILTVSLNLINGFTGQFSIGHMGFAGIGAYVSGTVTTLVFKLSPQHSLHYLVFIGAILLGGLAAMLVGILIGFPSLRLKGDYLAIVTLGFGEIIRTAFNNIDYVGGPRGLLGIPKFSTFAVIFAFALITIIVIRNIVFSTHGRALLSIRENELAAELVGIDTTKYKITAFAVGACFAGIAGGLLAHLLQIAHPTQYGFMGSIYVLIMLYAGGMGSITGSVIAAFALTFLSEGLRIGLNSLAEATKWPIGDQWRMVIFALLLIIIMLYRTEGLMGMREASILVPKGEERS